MNESKYREMARQFQQAANECKKAGYSTIAQTNQELADYYNHKADAVHNQSDEDEQC